MIEIKKLKETLRNRGLRATPQRLAVHEAMTVLGHASAEEVFDFITSRTAVRITFSSVYNILTQFTSMGFYRLRLSMDSKMYFDVDTRSEVHLYDRVNHSFRNIGEDEILSKVEQHFKGRRFRGFKVEGIEVQLICRPTRKIKQIK